MEYHLITFNEVGFSHFFGSYSSKEEAEENGVKYGNGYTIIFGEIL